MEQKQIGLGEAQKVFNIGHELVCGYLVQKWTLPDVMVAAAYYHHDESYRGKSHDYVRVFQLANCLLMEKGIGDMRQTPGLDLTFGKELISVSSVEAVFYQTMEKSVELDNLADYMAA